MLISHVQTAIFIRTNFFLYNIELSFAHCRWIFTSPYVAQLDAMINCEIEITFKDAYPLVTFKRLVGLSALISENFSSHL